MGTRNILIFYGLIFIPLAALVVSVKLGIVSAEIFIVLLLCYLFAYHPYISGRRLISMKKLDRKDFWRTFIPFWNTKYFKTLFFEV